MLPVFLPDQVRAAEKPLLRVLGSQLMRRAAFALACDAKQLLAAIRPGRGASGARVLVCAGSGGNGGDALFAAGQLAKWGATVTVWQAAESIHREALDFLSSTGKLAAVVTRAHHFAAHTVQESDLILDGLVGIGARGPLRGGAADIARILSSIPDPSRPVCVAVDICSGLDPVTGVAHVPHCPADVTVTFGGLKPVHVLVPGMVARTVVHGLGIDEELAKQDPCALVVTEEDGHLLRPLPHAGSTKYTGGVVGIHAGSAKYPGAAVLCTLGAVGATSPMVRYAGPCRDEVLRVCPEVVATDTVSEAGRCQAWVTGPGAGTDDRELARLLATDLPLVIDADALTQVGGCDELKKILRAREAVTVVTPHDGEYERIAGHGVGEDRICAAQQLAGDINAIVLLKGHVTVITDGDETYLVPASTSFAATPGSGDVLSGVTGAFLAQDKGVRSVALAAALHQWAAARCGGPVPARMIAESLSP